jgi:hypothetical protein
MAMRHRGTEWRINRIHEAIEEHHEKHPYQYSYPDLTSVVLIRASHMKGNDIVMRLEDACVELGISVPTRSSKQRSK